VLAFSFLFDGLRLLRSLSVLEPSPPPPSRTPSFPLSPHGDPHLVKALSRLRFDDLPWLFQRLLPSFLVVAGSPGSLTISLMTRRKSSLPTLRQRLNVSSVPGLRLSLPGPVLPCPLDFPPGSRWVGFFTAVFSSRAHPPQPYSWSRPSCRADFPSWRQGRLPGRT